jgi:Flp pilus assembly pilin Flp
VAYNGQEGGVVMLGEIRKFLTDEEGATTAEMVVIIAILVGVALLFKGKITELVKNIFGQIEGKTGNLTETN